MRPVSDKAVEADIGNLARVHAPFVPTDAPAARGMRITLDFEGFLAGASIPDSRMEKVTVVLGTGQLMPAAEEAVYGHCAARLSGSTSPTRRLPGAGAFRQDRAV